ncbi:enoyl-CoA hydratase [Roseovarius nubinhibens]|uniref:enoyl-CoA hydratase n=1 Tax=Roseovarius nubinhibens TaxID=314263 RepID=UPI001C0A3383|nr:enoyl-CoA hydratase [Roseovarius nubinhibens]MBU2999733.1 enoyl-CoA hydratase [Roseovarius nubinhibens]
MTRHLRPWLWLIAALAMLAGCYFPDDPKNTLATIERQGAVKVGVLAEPLPEADTKAIARFAESLGVRTDYVRGPSHALLAGLEEGNIHLLAGDIPEDTPMESHAALSNPYPPRVMLPGRSESRAEKRVLLLRKGENRLLLRLNRSLREAGQ